MLSGNTYSLPLSISRYSTEVSLLSTRVDHQQLKIVIILFLIYICASLKIAVPRYILLNCGQNT